MKNKFKYLVKTGLKRKFNSKGFKVANIILLIVIPLIFNIDRVVKFFGGEFSKPTNIYVVDEIGVYDNFESIFNETGKLYFEETNIELKKAEKSLEEYKDEIIESKSKDIILNIKHDPTNILETDVISYDNVDTILYQTLLNSINTTKTNYALLNSNIDKTELEKIYKEVKIEKTYLNEDMDPNSEFKDLIGSILIPIFVVPFFMLIIIVVQTIGTEINEEKTSKSMEVIISSISPKTHLFSKITYINLFVLIQGALLIAYVLVGGIIRFAMNGSNTISSLGVDPNQLISTFVDSGIVNNLLIALPFVIVIFVVSFIAYSLLAAILASMTTSLEDYQQLQTPLMIILMFAYYLSIIASVYENASFIKIASYVPFISAILSPVLLILGQTGVIDILISLVALIITCLLLYKFGIKVYKVGILNYSSSKLWKKIASAVKEK